MTKPRGGNVNNQKASRAAVESSQRRSMALDLRIAGLSYQRIGDRMGISRQAAHVLVTKALAQSNDRVSEMAEQLRRLELERLDLMQFSLWGRALRGDDRAVQSVIRIMDRRAKICGLDAPMQIEASWRDELQRYGLSPSEEFEKLVQLFMQKINERSEPE